MRDILVEPGGGKGPSGWLEGGAKQSCPVREPQGSEAAFGGAVARRVSVSPAELS